VIGQVFLKVIIPTPSKFVPTANIAARQALEALILHEAVLFSVQFAFIENSFVQLAIIRASKTYLAICLPHGNHRADGLIRTSNQFAVWLW
jgi:hypothetical protein